MTVRPNGATSSFTFSTSPATGPLCPQVVANQVPQATTSSLMEGDTGSPVGQPQPPRDSLGLDYSNLGPEEIRRHSGRYHPRNLGQMHDFQRILPYG